jgi:hypothetical protein
MNDFDSRWQACAARARDAGPAPAAAPPAGFAAAVVARWRGERQREPLPVLQLERLAAGFLAGAALAACLLFALFELRAGAAGDGLFASTSDRPAARVLWPL